MTDATPPTLPDRLSIDPRSPHHVAAVFEHGIGIRLNDKERFDVEEYRHRRRASAKAGSRCRPARRSTAWAGRC